MENAAPATEIKQPTPSELWRYLAMQILNRGAMAAGTPRDIGVMGAEGVQANGNMFTRILGPPKDPRDLWKWRGFFNFPTPKEAGRWLVNRLNRYLPADTGWKPPIEQAGGSPRGLLPDGWNPFLPRQQGI